MKNILLKASSLILGISLVACSSNTQQQNTAVGAVTGAVVGGVAGSAIGAGTGQVVAIGVGAVAGALIGGAIGSSVDSSDNVRMYRTMDYNPTNRPTTWTNVKTHRTYTMVPTSGMMTIHGNPNCRKFRATIMVKGKPEAVYGVACRQSSGGWKAVR